MLYRKMKKLEEELSSLGFGGMRLPTIGNDYSRIDEAKATELLRRAIDSGVNYVDTAYPYHNGESEPFLGRALADGYREKVYLATKLPSWAIKKREDMDRYLNEQLEKLQTDHIDFYLVHALMKRRWDHLKELGIAEFLESARADGRIKYAGFSFHDDIGAFKEIVDGYTWDFCQIQYNYLDESYQAGTEGLRYAAEKGLGVVIMEPLRGGMLAKEPPEKIKAIWAEAETQRSPAAWSLRWIWDHPEVTVVLSGMNEFSQLEENLQTAEESLPNSLSKEELALVERVKAVYRERVKVPCTSCRYCMPCPSGVNIPECFAQYNNASIFEDEEYARFVYEGLLGEQGYASQCLECGKCEKACPQQIPIREILKEVAEIFGK